MGITVKYLMDLGIEKETAEKIFAERGEEIKVEKTKYSELEKQLTEKSNSLNTLSKEFETLKQSNADSAEWKTKFETLQNDIAEKEKKAEEDRQAAEKSQSIANRFNTALGEKKFSHEAIRNDYLRRFGEALENKDFEGKSDADIFNELTKDDGAAFDNINVIKLEGGATKSIGSGSAEDLGKMDMAEYIAARQKMKG